MRTALRVGVVNVDGDLQVVPSKEQYEANIYEGIRLQQATFVNECHEEMMISTHKRNREMGEGKLKFEVCRLICQTLECELLLIPTGVA